MSGFTKVTICATSPGPHGQSLLVFRHPTGGVQLPAGSVEPGEQPEQAAVRELFEETGIDRVQALLKLRVLVTELDATAGVLSRSVQLSRGPACREEEAGELLRRGLPVRRMAEEANALLVCYEEFDYSVEPQVVTSSVSGWVPASAVARSVERVIFRARVAHDSRTSWQHFADGQQLEVLWLPLEPKPALVGPQQVWLDSVYEQLVADREG